MKSSLLLFGSIRQRAGTASIPRAVELATMPRRFFSVSRGVNRNGNGTAALVSTSTSMSGSGSINPTIRRENSLSYMAPSPQQPPRRSHYSYADGPGQFAFSDASAAERHSKRLQTWDERGFTVGIGGPVGSGKTALVLALIQRLAAKHLEDKTYPPLAVVTNDIFTQEDAQFLWKKQDVLPSRYIKAVETGGCPHAAIREDVSANLTACEELTQDLNSGSSSRLPPLILCESGGDNLAANFSNELADLTLYVIDVAGGDKVPRKGGPGITQSDLLVVNKIDLAVAVGADLGVMQRDADTMRSTSRGVPHDNGDHDHSHDHSHDDPPESGPTVFASVKNGTSLDEIEEFILEKYRKATE